MATPDTTEDLTLTIEAPETTETPVADTPAEKDAEAKQTLKTLVSDDDDADISAQGCLTFLYAAIRAARSILGGEMLEGSWFRQHFWYIVLCVLLCITYVANRYYCQEEIIAERHLNDSIQDRRYKLVTISSQITSKTRRGAVEKVLADTALKTSTQPLYLLPVEEVDTTLTH